MKKISEIPRYVRYIFLAAAIFLGTILILLSLGILGPAATLNFDRDADQNGVRSASLEEVVQHGQELWTQLRADGADIAGGPCLDDGETYPGWAIDLVREGRIDYLPENQCPSFLSGRVTRLVELSLEGNVVRVVPEGLWQRETTFIP